MSWSKQQMAQRALREIEPGSVVNLGIGLPTLVADLIGPDDDVWLQSENGILGMGPFPEEGAEDAQIINAGKQTVTLCQGAAVFDSATSFAMIRGGHVDLAILGAMQVGVAGDLANWKIPGGKTPGVGGAMDLAAGARRVVVMTRHVSKQGQPKLLRRPEFPLTAVGVVKRVISDLGVFDPVGDAYRIIELAPGVERKVAEEVTGAPLVGE